MIFKTNTDDFGRMGLGLNNSFKGIFNGDFFKEQNLLSDSDISAIKAYNAEIDKCVTSQTAFNRTMLNTSQQAQNVVAAANGNKVALEGMTKASKAAELGMKALSIAGNMIATMVVSWVLSEAISWLNDLAHAEENARKRSEELTSSYEDEKKNIDDSIAKYKELSEKLNDSSLSTSEVKSIKEQLLSVQDQLNEKYGAEAAQIDLVNGKYDEQIKKLDALAKKKASDYVSENYKDIQADQKYVSEKINLNKSLGFKGSQARPDDYSNAGFDLKKYIDRYDKLSAKVVNPDGQLGMTGDVNLVTNGTRQEVYDQLSQLFQDLSNDFGNSNEDVNKFKTTISGILEDSFDTDALDSANDRIKKYAQAEILSNDNTSESYNNLVDAIDNYNTALSSGEGVDDAKQKLLEAKQAAEDSTKDITNSGKALQDVYNSLDSEAPIELQVEFGKNVGEDLQKSYEDTINRFKSDTSDSSSKELDSLNKQLDKQTQNLTDAKENLQNEYDKISDWGLDDYADKIKNNTIQTKFGNVDMDKRTIIHWSDELKQTYADALASWDYDPEIGSIDTVFGGSERFGEDLNGNGWEVAFTPILPDGTFLSKDTVEEYINSILEEAYADDGKVTEDELTAIDAQGRQVGNTFVQGIFAGIDDSQNYDNNGNWAETVGRLMHFSGKFGAKQLADQEIDDTNAKLEETKKKIKEVSKGFDDSKKIKDFFDTEGINTQEEINQFNEVTKGINNADLAIQTWNEHVSKTATQSKTFESVWTSTSEEVKEKLLELAKSGEITPETISSTEEYKTLIDGTGESAESAKNKILNMLSATEKLSGASKGLSSLKTAYQEFADENNGKGFVTASTLESLPDVFKNLPHYDLFEQIVGDPNSGKEKIQSAFNDIAKDYLINQQTLMGVTQENMATYVANLKEMGIQNADEIVQNFVQAQNQQSQLLNEAESEYNNYLQTKDQADLEYLESSSSKNGQLVSALGSAYQGDYANWCNLLTTKAQAYNKFINAIKGSQASLINNTPFQSGTKQAQAIINDVKNHNGRTGGGTSLSLSNTNGLKGLGGTLMSSSAASPSRYTKEQYDAAKSYMDQVNQYNQLKSQLKLDLTNITTNFGGGYSFKPSSSGKSGGGSKSPSGGGSGSEKEPTKKDYDWIETLISRINRQVSNLGKTVSATYKTWSTRNNALAQELGSVNQQISAEQQAYNKYMQLANSVGLPEGYASLVRNGTIDVSTIADDDLNDKISKYQEYYNAALSASDAVQDLQDKLAELAKTRFDNVSAQFDTQIKTIEQAKGIYQSFIDQVETSGHQVSEKYYEYLISQEKNNINVLKNEFNSLSTAMGQAVADGRIQQGSEQWNDMYLSILDVQTAIEDANKSLLEYEKNLRQLKWDRFDKTEDYISKIQDESNFLVDLMSNQTLYDKDTGKDTKYATAIKGLHAVNYNAYMAQSDDYAKEIQEIDKEMAKDPYNTDLLERRQELLKAQQDAISNAEKEKQSIKSLVEEGIKAQLDALQKLIDKYKEALNSKKDLYDYQKSINEKTSNIASIQKQINAYGGDNSEETQSKVQQLQQNLKEAKSDLEDTEYQQYLNDQEQLLSTFYDEAEEWLNSRLDDLDGLIQQVIEETNTNAGNISQTIQDESQKVGYTITDQMKTIWNSSDGFTAVVSNYCNGFQNTATATLNSINLIKGYVENLSKKADAEAAEKARQAELARQQAAQKAAQAAAATQQQQASTSSSGGSSSGGGGSWGSWFVHKADSYPKNRLDIQNSIVDFS